MRFVVRMRVGCWVGGAVWVDWGDFIFLWGDRVELGSAVGADFAYPYYKRVTHTEGR